MRRPTRRIRLLLGPGAGAAAGASSRLLGDRATLSEDALDEFAEARSSSEAGAERRDVDVRRRAASSPTAWSSATATSCLLFSSANASIISARKKSPPRRPKFGLGLEDRQEIVAVLDAAPRYRQRRGEFRPGTVR